MNTKEYQYDWAARTLSKYKKMNRLTLVELAESLDVTHGYLSHVINKKTTVSDSFIAKIEALTGTTMPVQYQISDDLSATMDEQPALYNTPNTAANYLNDHIATLKTVNKELLDALRDLRKVVVNLSAK